MKKMLEILQVTAGAAEIAFGAFLMLTPATAALGSLLVASGAGLVLNGIGTILTPDQHQVGVTSTARNPIASQDINYGRVRKGGTFRCL